MAKAPVSNADDPGTETDIPSIDQKLNALDDDLNPIEPDEEATEASEEPVEDESEEPEEDEKGPKDEETEEDEKPEGEGEEEPEGYTIDEGEEESTETEEQPEVTPEDQYILDGIKDSAITVRGTVGDSKEVKEYKVLAPQQLPRGFHYTDDYEAGVAFAAFNILEQQARELQGKYRQEQTNKSVAEVTEKERQADRSDIARLQKADVIPLFKAQPDDANFESDPAVELVQNVLDFKDRLNTQYNDAYSKGAAYRHIGFEEAYYRYQRENPTKGNPAQSKEDRERREFARRTNRPSAGRPGAAKAPKLPAGASSRDLDMYIENLEI